MNLTEFRRQDTGLMIENTERPFVCDGSPLGAAGKRVPGQRHTVDARR
jgi:hypothetical protein